MQQKSLLSLFILLLIFACAKEKDTTPYTPTPYKVEAPLWMQPMEIPSDNPMTVEGVALGKRLFYDTKLSGNNTMSCGSCHAQENAFSDSNQFSVGISGKAGNRQSMAIFNLGWSDLFFWDGRAKTLEEQAHDPVVNPIELNTTWQAVMKKLQADKTYPTLFEQAFRTKQIDSQLVTKAIAQFERSIVSFNSRFDKYYYQQDSTVFNASEKRGFNLFFLKGSCLHCHGDAILTDNTLRNNGLDNIFSDKGQGEVTKKTADDGKFKVTTLRNIALTAPYMHDGRFKTLEQVVKHYNGGVIFGSPNLDKDMDHFLGGLDFTEQDEKDLVAFLKTLTDSTLITDKRYAK
jgi:cytochrome c peroxidase